MRFSTLTYWFVVLALSAGLLVPPTRGAIAASDTRLNIQIISLCGNSIVDAGEECEGVDLQSETCESRGYDGGTLGCTASCTFNVSSCTQPIVNSGSGGGTSKAPTRATASVQLSGLAFPQSEVILLKDGQRETSTVADPDARFSISLSGLSSGTYAFSLYSQDDSGQQSSTFTFSVSVTSGTLTTVDGIFLAPTLVLNRTELFLGEPLTVFGKTTPNSLVTIVIRAAVEFVEQIKADIHGGYNLMFDTQFLIPGNYRIEAKASKDGKESVSSTESTLTLLDNDLVDTDLLESDYPAIYRARSDITNDSAVNIVDFSVGAYWYLRPNPPQNVDINQDGIVDLVDFAIMAFYWTG